VQTWLQKKKKKKKEKREKMTGRYQKQPLGVISRLIRFIMAASCIVVRFTWKSLGALRAALVAHAERLNSLLEPSWPNAEKVQKEMYNMVDTLMVHVLDQKWFSAFA
jgi:hypothetical protein